MKYIKEEVRKGDFSAVKNDRGHLPPNKFIKFLKTEFVGWVFVLPVILGMLIFTLVPAVQSFIYSFAKKFTLLSPPSEFGFYNYVRIFTHDDTFLKSLSVTFTYAIVMVPLSTVLTYALAMFLHQKLPGIGIFRTIYYLPTLIPGVATALIWKDIYHPTFGFGNQILSMLGLPESSFIYDKDTAMVSFMFTNIFGLGGAMITWLAALNNIPDVLYEAAKIDGAGWAYRTFRITIPLSTPMIFYNVVLGIIGALQMFGPAYIMGGGPDSSLLFYAIKVYNAAFESFKMGYACALAWVLFVIIFVITLVFFKLSGKWVFYGEDMD